MKQLNEMSTEELKAKAYDLIMLSSKIQNELGMIQQMIRKKSNPIVKVSPKGK